MLTVVKSLKIEDGPAGHSDLENLITQLTEIRSQMIKSVMESGDTIHPRHKESAKNLLQYLTMRRRDLRPVQSKLAEMGLSSLGRSESHVLATVNAVLSTLHKVARRELNLPAQEVIEPQFRNGEILLQEHTEIMLGKYPPGRNVHIMVTMPSEAAVDYPLVLDLLKSGMDCMRINCAHDLPADWLHMIEHLHRARKVTGKE